MFVREAVQSTANQNKKETHQIRLQKQAFTRNTWVFTWFKGVMHTCLGDELGGARYAVGKDKYDIGDIYFIHSACI